MAEQPDLFAGGVAETAWRAFTPAIGAAGVDPVAALDEEAALALLLARCGAQDAEIQARRLVSHFGGVGRVLGAPAADLARVVGEALAVELGLQHALLMRLLAFPVRRRAVIRSWSAAKAYVQARLSALPREVFHVLFLDKKNQLIANERMGEGSISHAPVYPREIVRRRSRCRPPGSCWSTTTRPAIRPRRRRTSKRRAGSSRRVERWTSRFTTILWSPEIRWRA